MRLAPWIALLVLGCGDKDGETGTASESDADTDSDTDSDTDADTDADNTLVPMDGCVEYSDGTTVSASTVRVQMCNINGCIPAFPDDTGCFSYTGLNPSSYAFDAVPISEDGTAGHTYSTPLTVVELVEGQEPLRLAQPLIIYTYTNTLSPLSAAEFDAGNGLTISVDPSSFEGPTEDPDADFVASVPVDWAASGLPVDTLGGDVVAMWYLGPANAAVGSWPFTASGLEPGTELHVYNAHYNGFEWVDLGTATVGEDGVFVAPIGIAHLSTLVLIQE